MHSTAPKPLTGQLITVWVGGLILIVFDNVALLDSDVMSCVLGFAYLIITHPDRASLNQNIAAIGEWLEKRMTSPTTGLIGDVSAERLL